MNRSSKFCSLSRELIQFRFERSPEQKSVQGTKRCSMCKNLPMNRPWRSMVLKRRNNQQINEVQLGLISTWTLDMVIQTNLVSPVKTKQVWKVDLNWTCFSVRTRTFPFLVHFSVPPNFWTCFGTDPLIFSVTTLYMLENEILDIEYTYEITWIILKYL